jgi:hypothetical protein
MYNVVVQNKNDLDNKAEYYVGEKEMLFLGRVFGNSHYIITVEEILYSETKDGIFPEKSA